MHSNSFAWEKHSRASVACSELEALQRRLVAAEARHLQALHDLQLRILEELDAAQHAPKPAGLQGPLALPESLTTRCALGPGGSLSQKEG